MRTEHVTDNITTLRAHLFATLRGLSDKSAPMEIERARAVTDVAQAITNTAKVEIEYMKLTGGGGSGFIPEDVDEQGAKHISHTSTGTKTVQLVQGGTVTQHRMGG